MAVVVQFSMPRRVAVMLAAVLALAAHTAVVAFDRSTTAVADNAWLIVVDDVHVDFVNTGSLRTLLRAVARELIQDGDLFEFRATGPSTSTPQTANRDVLATAITGTTGNGLKAGDTLGALLGSPASNEVLSRANTALDTAQEAVWTFGAGDGQRKAIIYVSRGYDIDAFPGLADRMSAFARRAREDGITTFAIDARSLISALEPAPNVESALWLRHIAATRLSLRMIAEQAGGFVIENANEPTADLIRIARQMRQACSCGLSLASKAVTPLRLVVNGDETVPPRHLLGAAMPNNDEIKGKFDQVKGKVKQGIGEATGDQELQDEGVVDQASGEIQEGFGTARRKVGEAVKDLGDRIKQ